MSERRSPSEVLTEIAYLMTQLLSEARLIFTINCLKNVMKIKPSENFVFSPYNIYEALVIVYILSSRYIKIHLTPFLRFYPDERKEWLRQRSFGRRLNSEEYYGYYDEHICWINDTTCLNDIMVRKNIMGNIIDPEKCIFFNYSDFPTLMNAINEVLRNEVQDYIPHPVELNTLKTDIDFILSSVLRFKDDIFQPATHTNVLSTHLLKKPRTIICPELNMFMTEISFVNKTQSMFVLFPAVQQDSETNNWQLDENISDLVERLTTKEGSDAFRKVLKNEELSRENMSEVNVIYPDFFEIEKELPLDQLLEMFGINQVLKPLSAISFGITEKILQLNGVKHHAYIKVTSESVIASAINIFFNQSGGSLTSIEELTDYTKYKNSFVWLIYDNRKHTILFIGVINKNHQLAPINRAAHGSSSAAF